MAHFKNFSRIHFRTKNFVYEIFDFEVYIIFLKEKINLFKQNTDPTLLYSHSVEGVFFNICGF